MKIAKFAALIASGVTFNLRLSDAGDKNIQLDLIPVGKSNKAGINLPPKSFIGTADEIDDQLPGYLEKYLGTCERITMISANAEAELAAAEEAAKKVAAEKVAERASKSKGDPKKATTGGKPQRDMNAGMLEDDDLPEGQTSSSEPSEPTKQPQPPESQAVGEPALPSTLF